MRNHRIQWVMIVLLLATWYGSSGYAEGSTGSTSLHVLEGEVIGIGEQVPFHAPRRFLFRQGMPVSVPRKAF